MKMTLRIAVIEAEGDPDAVHSVINAVREAFQAPAVDGKQSAMIVQSTPAETPRPRRRRKAEQLEPEPPAELETPAEEPAAEELEQPRPPANPQTVQRVLAFLKTVDRPCSARRIAMEGLGWKTSTASLKVQLCRMVEEDLLYTDDGGRTFELPIREGG